MNGVFIRDMFLEGGLIHPSTFATEYYLQYPGINIGFYPPFFYLSSAPFLVLFGASHQVSQAVVTLYALIVGTFIYFICVGRMDRLASLATALSVMALPDMALWSRQVQPDVPAIALLIASAFSLIRHLECGRTSWLISASVCLGLSILTRVQSVFAVPAVLFFLLFVEYEQQPAMRLRLNAIAIAGLISLPAVLMFIYFSHIDQALAIQMPGMPKLLSLDNWLWYVEALPKQMGWPALVFTISGVIAGMYVFRREVVPQSIKILMAFLMCSWGVFTIVSSKDSRFNLPSIPFLFMVSSLGFYFLAPRIARFALVALALWLVFQATCLTKVPVVSGFKEAALIAQALTPINGNVLISAHRDGSFIYNMRTLDNRRDIGIRRADKLFVEIKIMRELGIKDRMLNKDEIEKLLKLQNIATIVNQVGYLSDQSSMQNFQKILDTGNLYRRIKTIEIQGATSPKERELVIYSKI